MRNTKIRFTERELLDVMEKAVNVLKRVADKENCFIDDCGWGDDCFQINVFKYSNDPRKCECEDTFYFRYDENDIWSDDLEEQCMRKLGDHISTYWE